MSNRKTAIERLSSRKYYERMCSFDEIIHQGFDAVHQWWLSCFAYALREFHDTKMPASTIRALFYGFSMRNWNALQRENTYYCKCSQEDLIRCFCGSAHYISDRASMDRIFRTHWLFLNAYEKEMDNER